MGVDIEKIVEFIKRYAPQYQDYEAVRQAILKHVQYGTCMALEDGGEIIACCRWNISGNVAHVLDLIITPRYRNKRLMKKMLLIGLRMWPQVKFISFERLMKYPDRKQKVYSINEFLGRR